MVYIRIWVKNDKLLTKKNKLLYIFSGKQSNIQKGKEITKKERKGRSFWTSF